jgi:DNA-binding MarR family transcriptional regulator
LSARVQPLSQRELARRLQYDPSNITALADALQARGVVERQPDPSDRRFRLVALTNTGKRVKSDLESQLTRPLDAIARLSPTHQQQLLQLLRSVFGQADVPGREDAGRSQR